MKKNLLFSILCLLPALTFAQNSSGGFQLGVKGGINLSQLSFGDFVNAKANPNGSPSVNVDGQTFRNSISDSFNSRTGTSFGIYARFGKNLYLQPELLYTTTNGQFDVIRNGISESVTIKSNSFDIPVLLGIKGGPFRVLAGPMVSLRIDDNQRLGQALSQYTSGSLNDAWSKGVLWLSSGGRPRHRLARS